MWKTDFKRSEPDPSNFFSCPLLNTLFQFHCVKSVHIRSYFGPHFLAFGLNTERYFVSLHIQSECVRIQSECRKIRARNYSVFGHFLRSVFRSNIFNIMGILENDILYSISITPKKVKGHMLNLFLSIYHLLVRQILPWKLSKEVLNYWLQILKF